MAALTVQTVTRTPTVLGGVSASGGGDSFTNSGAEFLLITNNSGTTARTVTIVTTATVDSLSVADRTVTMEASTTKVVGPFPRYAYGTTVSLTYDVATNLVVSVIKVTPEPA